MDMFHAASPQRTCHLAHTISPLPPPPPCAPSMHQGHSTAPLLSNVTPTPRVIWPSQLRPFCDPQWRPKPPTAPRRRLPSVAAVTACGEPQGAQHGLLIHT